MTQQRTFPENVRTATSKRALNPCRKCGRPTASVICRRHPTYAPRVTPSDHLPLILDWARDLRTEQAIEAYARTKVDA